ncbi:hypothetical protein MTR67_012417 [Solanum verrucosum]|uniref:Uncharacterized protein n=1 Tax=Solanum verrucosum TaxID=315347 RepID=A0AAF0Q8J9_SOLVR|nr:hypothetical protein MTR67_012417 [Solanum verrucosum]
MRYPSEKKNCNRINKGMTDFSDFIEDLELVDPELSGGKYIWKKGDRHTTAARLDKILFSEEWEANFRNIRQHILHRVTSDHSPIMLQCGAWENANFIGKSDYVLVAKLKALKEKLKEWSKTTQGNLGTQKQNVLKQLAELEKIQENRTLRPEEITSKAALISVFEDIEEIAWRQRSRAV